ncbi:thioredoxin domain-containing protein 3 homolog isoform X2 [Gigantopelta aegis]|uniref:thioredoxin domain-containing protein 3 homolog isoform X2 n=1 Tax=Gigantopelta aegis TaxID=1735272 RepID=UPI001B888A90|nr:thioredoxin domain-containing protein 3 homolog isoform X2 [Gigantopelta aegis]
MARRKHEVQLQQEIETTEEWEELMAKEGLFVIDVYQEWCGPCNALVANFRRLKNEIGDDLLHFAIAKADTIEALDKYRGRCEPCFLFYAGGVLVAVIHGARTPEIQRTITEQLQQEHKVQDGAAERKEVRDPIIVAMEDDEKLNMEEDHVKEDEESEMYFRGERIIFGDPELEKSEVKGFTVALIKPDAVQSGKVDEIIEQMEEAGIEIIAKEERQLTEEEAREFYSHLEGEDYFEDLIAFMSSGPSFALVLTKGQKGDNVLQEWREMLGPPTVEKAKEEAPESLRAKYGANSYMNALHGSDSPERAARELAFFFPNLALPTVSADRSHRPQRTLALIRPDAFRKHKDEIMDKIKEAGFRVALQKEMTLTKEQAEEFYKEHRDKPYFEELTTRMSNGPLMALGLAREDAVKGWRDMLGPPEVEEAKQQAPDSLRALFADDLPINPIHGSDSEESAQQELQYFFPMEQTVAIIKPDAIGTKDEIVSKIHEAGFRIAARKETQITRDIAEEFYSEHKDKDYYEDLVEHMVSGPTLFMVLSREDAVKGWRETIGPTDPEVAKTEAPDTLRAHFGENILKNAVHGSSNPEHVKQSINKVFGPLEFNPDGTVKVGTVEIEATSAARKQVEEGSQDGEQDQATEDTQQIDQDQSEEEDAQQIDQDQSEEEDAQEIDQDQSEAEEESPDVQQEQLKVEEESQDVQQEQTAEGKQGTESAEKQEEGEETQQTSQDQTKGEETKESEEQQQQQQQQVVSGEDQTQEALAQQVEDGSTDAQAENRESDVTQQQTEAQPASDEQAKSQPPSRPTSQPPSQTPSQPPSQPPSRPQSQAAIPSDSQTKTESGEQKTEEEKPEDKKDDTAEGAEQKTEDAAPETAKSDDDPQQTQEVDKTNSANIEPTQKDEDQTAQAVKSDSKEGGDTQT